MRLLIAFVCLLTSSLALRAAETPQEHAAHAAAATGYHCPMHPWIRSDKPGKCTICGMDLVAATSEAPASADGAAVVSLSPTSINVTGVKTTVVARQPLTRTLRVVGRIDDDDTRHRLLSARVPGRVDKLFITFVGETIDAGAPLATLWSPEVLTAERVFVERLKAGDIAFSASERAAAREQLIQLGLSEADLAALERDRVPSAIVTIRAPSAGTVVAKSVYEGQYVQASDRLFEIGDFSHMWFVFDAYPQDIPWLHVGQRVEVTTRAVPGEVITSTIEFIDPNFDEARQTTRVRAVLPNPHYSVAGEPHLLPHRVLAEGRVLVETPAVLTAPRTAVLNTGSGPVAYVEIAPGQYTPRALKLGRTGDALVEVMAGLAENERVVTEGNLLIDAQAQLAREGSGVAAATPEDSAPATAAAMASPPAPAENPLTALANLASDASDALATDDFARYARLVPQLNVAAKPFALAALEPGTNLVSARTTFEPWSTAVASLVAPQQAQLGVKVFVCPMSPVLHKGRWVQHALPLKNPFFGSAMPTCGEELQ